MAPDTVRDEYNGDLTVVYTFGPQFGRRVVTHADLEQLQMNPRSLRRAALDHLEVLSSRAEFHGQPPALMLSFEGLESSLLLANDFWTRLQGAVPGQLVVGVPARDVVIVTGSMSQPGLEKARRCVERIFFAGDEHLLSRSLLIRRGDGWEPFDRPAAPARPAGRPTFGPAHQHGVGQPPRQFQEHQSWPGERVAPMRPADPRVAPSGRPAPVPSVPAAAASGHPGPMTDHTGFPVTSTGMQPAVISTGMQPAVTSTGMQPAVISAGMQPPISHRPRSGRRRPAHADVAQYSAVPYSAMPYSAAPHSPAPSSPAPYSAVPYSAVPYSAMPYSAVPNSGSPYSIAPAVRQRGAATGSPVTMGRDAKPTYGDDLTSPSSLPRPLHPEYGQTDHGRADLDRSGYDRSGYDRVGYDRSGYDRPSYDRPGMTSTGDVYGRDAHDRPADPAQPSYPGSWGSAPSASPARSEFRSGPRARFAR
jgi:hypothetical protein